MHHALTARPNFELNGSHSSPTGSDSAQTSARTHTFDFRLLPDRRKPVAPSLPATVRTYGQLETGFEGNRDRQAGSMPSASAATLNRAEPPLSGPSGATVIAHTHGNPSTSLNIGLNQSLLLAVLDQVDYGLAVINTETRQVVHANLHAQNALHPTNGHATGLCLNRGVLSTRHADQADHLATALNRTKSRVRTLLRLTEPATPEAATTLPSGATPSTAKSATAAAKQVVGAASQASASQGLSIAVVPLAGADIGADDCFATLHDGTSMPSTSPSYALLVFAKQQLCDTTTVTLFARERGLTGAEGQVLEQVCKGLRPSQIATRHGVQISTVRTQLRAIRHKTASDSVRELVEKVSVLPPLARNLPNLWGNNPSFSPAFG